MTSISGQGNARVLRKVPRDLHPIPQLLLWFHSYFPSPCSLSQLQTTPSFLRIYQAYSCLKTAMLAAPSDSDSFSQIATCHIFQFLQASTQMLLDQWVLPQTFLLNKITFYSTPTIMLHLLYSVFSFSITAVTPYIKSSDVGWFYSAFTCLFISCSFSRM